MESERSSSKRQVPGSSPGIGKLSRKSGVKSQELEHEILLQTHDSALTTSQAGIAKRPKAAVCRTVNPRFESGCPLQFFMWFVAQLAEHFNVNEAVAGSNPVDPPNLGAVAERRMHFAVYEDDDGSSPFGPANLCLRTFSLDRLASV